MAFNLAFHYFCGVSTRGREKRKELEPCWVFVTKPPISSTSRLEIGSPSPDPYDTDETDSKPPAVLQENLVCISHAKDDAR